MALRFFDVLSLGYTARIYLRQRSRAVLAFKKIRAEFYADVWGKAASALGLATRRWGDALLEIRLPSQKRLLVHNNYISLDDMVTVEMTLDKGIIYTLLGQAGFPIPEYKEFRAFGLGRARKLIRGGLRPAVVKPADGTGGGSGITTNIRGPLNMVRAAARARAYSQRIIVERHVPGDTFRFLYLDGELLDCIIRRPPAVVGDGRSTIRRLVKMENRRRQAEGISRSQILLTFDLEMDNTLRAQGLSRRSIPPAGRSVVVKTVINGNRGAENESVTEPIAPSILETTARIVRTIGLRYIGVDIITRDITKDLSETGGVVLEVNAGPGLYYHYYKKNGPTAIVEKVLQREMQRRVEEGS